MTRPSLEEAIREHHAAQPPPVFVQAQGETGELAVAESTDGATRRVVLLAGTDARGIGQILLASNALDQATDLDLIVEPAESGAPYELMIQAELYGPVFIEQLDRLVGRCSSQTTEAVRSALRTDGESLEGRTVGLPLGGVDDPRRRFKEDELVELQAIVSTCRRWLAGDPSEVVSIHPEALFPPPTGTSLEEGFDRLDSVVDLLSSFERAGRHLPFELLALLDDQAITEIRRWKSEYGFDMWNRLQRLASRAETEQIERQTVRSSELTESFLLIHAESGTKTVDLVASHVSDGTTQIVRHEAHSRIHFCRARTRALEEVV